MSGDQSGDGIVHRCPSGETHELSTGRYLPQAKEYRLKADCGCVVYHGEEVEHA